MTHRGHRCSGVLSIWGVFETDVRAETGEQCIGPLRCRGAQVWLGPDGTWFAWRPGTPFVCFSQPLLNDRVRLITSDPDRVHDGLDWQAWQAPTPPDAYRIDERAAREGGEMLRLRADYEAVADVISTFTRYGHRCDVPFVASGREEHKTWLLAGPRRVFRDQGVAGRASSIGLFARVALIEEVREPEDGARYRIEFFEWYPLLTVRMERVGPTACLAVLRCGLPALRAEFDGWLRSWEIDAEPMFEDFRRIVPPDETLGAGVIWLREREREVVRLRQQGFSLKEIASSIGLSYATVRNILYEAGRHDRLPDDLVRRRRRSRQAEDEAAAS